MLWTEGIACANYLNPESSAHMIFPGDENCALIHGCIPRTKHVLPCSSFSFITFNHQLFADTAWVAISGLGGSGDTTDHDCPHRTHNWAGIREEINETSV